VLLESFIGRQDGECWNDFVAVFARSSAAASAYPGRIVDAKPDFANAVVHGREGFLNPRQLTEDQEKLVAIQQIATGAIKIR